MKSKSDIARAKRRDNAGRFIKTETKPDRTGTGKPPRTVKPVSVKSLAYIQNAIAKRETGKTVAEFNRMQSEVNRKIEKLSQTVRDGKTDIMLDIEKKIKTALPYIVPFAVMSGCIIAGYILPVLSIVFLVFGFVSGYIVRGKLEKPKPENAETENAGETSPAGR